MYYFAVQELITMDITIFNVICIQTARCYLNDENYLPH